MDRESFTSDVLAIPQEWPQAEALFRAQLVAPLLDPLSSPEERTAWRRWVTSRRHVLPNGESRQVGERTLRRWVAQARAAGYEGLQTRPRRDRGRLRTLKQEWIDRAIELKREEPRRSVPHILRMLRMEFDEPIDVTPGALWRHLAKEGLGGRTALPKQGFRRWESSGVGQVWQSDVKFGPHLPDPLRPGQLRRTYLIAFLDDYSRYITHAEFFFADDVYALEVCFQKALLRAGKPARVYVDQGKIFQSKVFRTACASLGIRHMSAKPYSPEGKGKIERFFRNIDDELLLEWHRSPGKELAVLNEQLWAWLAEVYHTRVHSETKQTPTARFIEGERTLLDPETVHDAFLWRAVRRVDKTGRIRLDGNVYETEPGLEGRLVDILFHPLDLRTVRVFCEGRRHPDAAAVELLHEVSLQVNPRHHKQGPEEAASPPVNSYFTHLVDKHELNKERTLSPLRFAQHDEGSDGDV